jgi:hypothetical protein
MLRVFTLHKLKEGSTIEEYRAWSPEDQRVNLSHPLVKNFEVCEVVGADRNPMPDSTLSEKAPFDVVEITEVESWDDFVKLCKDEKLQEIEKTWSEKFLDEKSLLVLALKKI